MKFIINRQVFFDSDSATLNTVAMSDEPVQISNPAKRLLLLLIFHQGETVSREVIFKKVWDDFGMISSNNNLNQCISKLRRLLKKLGIHEEVITTVPKLGFMLRQQIYIEKLSDATQSAGEVESEYYAPEPVLAIPPSNVGQHRVNPLISAYRFTTCYWPWIILSLSILLLCLAASLAWSSGQAEKKDVYMGVAGNCNIMISNNIVAGKDKTELKTGLLNYARSLAPQCGSNEYLLIIKNNFMKQWINDLTRFYFMRCGYIRESKAEVCWSLSEPANYASP